MTHPPTLARERDVTVLTLIVLLVISISVLRLSRALTQLDLDLRFLMTAPATVARHRAGPGVQDAEVVDDQDDDEPDGTAP